jgi:hypothetical protein
MLAHAGGRLHHLGRFHRAMGGHSRHRSRRGSLLYLLLDGGRGGRFMVPLLVEGVRSGAVHAEVSANQVRRVLVQRAGVGLLFCHAQFREQVENALRLDLELSRQLINADFAHS